MEFYSFEETFKKLQISEEELRELVVSGEVRCFRDGAEMKFKKADVDALKGMERKKKNTTSPAPEHENFSSKVGSQMIWFFVLAIFIIVGYFLSKQFLK